MVGRKRDVEVSHSERECSGLVPPWNIWVQIHLLASPVRRRSVTTFESVVQPCSRYCISSLEHEYEANTTLREESTKFGIE
ncbi:hypothetical protein Sjap_017013 [Stephania japonica]|uniref:Uncharacterized protein n=1 Tax=Stephania japonica TaxID=461633 RepID=A0AAP0NIX1_9MAGN